MSASGKRRRSRPRDRRNAIGTRITDPAPITVTQKANTGLPAGQTRIRFSAPISASGTCRITTNQASGITQVQSIEQYNGGGRDDEALITATYAEAVTQFTIPNMERSIRGPLGQPPFPGIHTPTP
jgi:hypothetical protein